ncbi:MAG: FG-GAP repeat protein, partial [Flavobacteriales bacterium]|nr:FG-GAP repeat protein [Flavobacteriales bacterium]
MKNDDTVDGYQKISSSYGNLSTYITLNSADYFGSSITSMGDLDNDGNIDIAVGATGDDDIAVNAGAVYVLMLTDSGTVKMAKKIIPGLNGFEGHLNAVDLFGSAVCGGFDIDMDGVNDLLAGAPSHDGSRIHTTGIVYVLLMNTDGTVKRHLVIDATTGNFTGHLKKGYGMAKAISVTNYNTQDNTFSIALGSRTDDSAPYAGGVYMLKVDLSVLKDYSNNLFINTKPINENISYQLNFRSETYLYTTGGIETFLITSSPTTETAMITVNETLGYGQLELLFDVTLGQIENLRIIRDSLSGGDTLALDDNLYRILNDGKELILYQSDTTELPTDSLLYGFILEGGLGISPDSDGSFDVLAISGTENITSFSLTIKDLTNNIVFATTDKLNFWNGQFMGNGSLVPIGAYNYSVQINGETYDGQILVQY